MRAEPQKVAIEGDVAAVAGSDKFDAGVAKIGEPVDGGKRETAAAEEDGEGQPPRSVLSAILLDWGVNTLSGSEVG
jgi:hypothetical protein